MPSRSCAPTASSATCPINRSSSAGGKPSATAPTKACCTSRKDSMAGLLFGDGQAQPVRLRSLRNEFGKGWDVRIPFDQGRPIADDANGGSVELPHRLRHRVIVRIDQKVAGIGVAGKMVFGDSAGGDSGKICGGVELVVFGADMNVVNVEQ